jgi:hypothetical protein
MVVYPRQCRVIDDVGRHAKVIRVLHHALHYRGDGLILKEDDIIVDLDVNGVGVLHRLPGSRPSFILASSLKLAICSFARQQLILEIS